ncbi:hypothetical protein [Aureispira sp. CCB-E]|uniref:hypothetical protein n=1 Tax=Aureispira sp. CCB-E TaxID=3051121 RepID=UPI0028694095|nr:hypothetical protein [Aureispira sp. CCB-E]WMX17464.1 hypothetical protein QP953_13870 [Aureispira sp. CCB-E]
MENLAKSQRIDSKNQRDINRAHAAFCEVPFCQEYRGLKRMGNMISIIASAFSWNTQVFGIGFLAFLWLSSFLDTKVAIFMAGALGVLGATVLEISKRIIARLFFKNYYNESQDTSIKLGSSIGLVVALSVGLSFYASLFIPNMVVEAPPLASINEIQTPFDADIKELQQERDKYRKNREYRGKLRSEEAAVVLEFNQKIQTLKNEKKAAVKMAKADNKQLVNTWVTENNDVGLSIGWFMILLELLCVGGIAFNWYCENQTRFDGSPAPEPSTPLNKGKRKGLNTTLTKKETTTRQKSTEEPTEAEHAGDNSQTTTPIAVIDLNVFKQKKRIISLDDIDFIDNDDVDTIKRLKDAIAKNYKRSFTSKTQETKANNYNKAMERCVLLQEKYGIESHFDPENEKVTFKNLETA